MSTSFKTFNQLNGIPEWLKDQLNELQIERPTTVQRETIPQALKGKDIIGSSRTGQGKTMCFAIPIITSISNDPGAFRALIVTPTRELALQITQQFKILGRKINIKVLSLTGGHDMTEQILQLGKKPHVLVCTPGRLRRIISDPINEPHLLSFKRIKYFVLDEADRLLAPEFSSQLSVILDVVPSTRQIMLFSATMNKSLEKIASYSMNNPFIYKDDLEDFELVSLNTSEDGVDIWAVPETLSLEYMFMPMNVKDCYLVYLLRKFEHLDSIIIFVQSCKACEEVSYMLNELDPPIKNSRLHRWMKQSDRENSLSSFKSRITKVLVATDLASRGLDIQECKLVIQYNVPRNPKDFIHRSGRVARKGREGSSITLVDQFQVNLLLEIEKHLTRKVEESKVEEDHVLKHLNEAVMAKEAGKLLLDEEGFYERLAKLKKRKRQYQLEEDSQTRNNSNENGLNTKKKKIK